MSRYRICKIFAATIGLLFVYGERLDAQQRVGPFVGYEFGLPLAIDHSAGAINSRWYNDGSGEGYNHSVWLGAGFDYIDLPAAGWNASARFALGIGSGRFTSFPYEDLPRLDIGDSSIIVFPRRTLDVSAQTGSLRLDFGLNRSIAGNWRFGGGVWIDYRFVTGIVAVEKNVDSIGGPDRVFRMDGIAGDDAGLGSDPFSFGPSLALSVDIPTGRSMVLRPELGSRLNVPALLQGTGVGALSAGLGLSLMFDVAPLAPPLGEAAPPVPPQPPARDTSDISIDLYAGEGSDRSTTARVGLKNTLHRRHLPLLPLITYGRDSVSIPARYTRLARAEAERFSLSSLSGLSPAFLHAQMLNIIGMRMKGDRGMSISIVASVTRNETEATGSARALDVERYLTEVWGIEASRIVSEVRHADDQAGAIRIRSTSSALFAPVVLQWIAREIAVPPIGLDPQFDATQTRSWKIVVTQGSRTLGEYGSQARTSLDGINLPLLLRGRHGDSTLVPLVATLTIEENDGETRTARDELRLVWSDDTTARGTTTGNAEIFSYLLLDPPASYPELSTTNRAMMLKIQESARRGARMTLSGFGKEKPIAERAGGEILAALEKRQLGDVELHVITDDDRFVALPEEAAGSSGVDVVVENGAE